MLSYTPVFTKAHVDAKPDLGNMSSVAVVGEQPGNQVIWAGCGNQLCSWPAAKPDAVTEWGPDSGVVVTHWHSVLLDHSGTLWAVGDHQVIAMPRGAGRFVERDLPNPDVESVSRQMPLVQDREGRVLVPSKDGVARWEGTHWRLIGPANGLRSNHITGLSFDSAGDLWMGSLGRGLYHWIGYEDWEGWGEGQNLPSPAARPGRCLRGTAGRTAR
jgi:ligand-binding sensor domain-containing protein